MRSDRHYNPAIYVIGYAIFSIPMAFGRLVGDRIIKQFTALKIFQAGSFLAAIGFAMVVYPTVKHAELAGFCCIGLGASNIILILFSASGKIPSMAAGFALTIVTTLGYTGALIGPDFIGFLAEATSLALALGAVALCLLAVGASGRRILAPQAYQQVT